MGSMARLSYSSVSVFSLCLLLAGCSLPAGWEREPFPEELPLGRVIGSCQSGGLREGIVVAFVELRPGAAAEIEKRGLAYFDGLVVGRNTTTLQPWAKSPLEKPDGINAVDSTGAPVYAWPMAGCGDRADLDNPASLKAVSDFDEGNAFYTTFNNGEGLLIIAPRANVAGYFYFG